MQDQYKPSRIDGEFIVSVGNAVATEISPADAAGVSDDEDRAFRITYASPVMTHTIESVDLDTSEINGAKRSMYMMQRASSGEQRDQIPSSCADPYDVLCYLDDMLRVKENDIWEESLERRRSDDRYDTEPPEWVKSALS